MDILIRRAEQKDLSDLMELAAQALLEAGSERFGLSPDLDLARDFYSIYIKSGATIALVAEVPGGKVAGSIAASLSPWFIGNPGLIVADNTWWFVDKKYRGPEKVGLKLLNELERQVRQRGVRAFQMRVMTFPGQSAKIGNYITRLGFRVNSLEFFKQMEG